MPTTTTNQLGQQTLLRCEKCGAELRVPTELIALNDDLDDDPLTSWTGRVAYIERNDGWSRRHDGEELLCPFHPGMRYFLAVIEAEPVEGDGSPWPVEERCMWGDDEHDVREIEYAVNLDAITGNMAGDAELAARDYAQREGWRVVRTIDVEDSKREEHHTSRVRLVLLECVPVTQAARDAS